MNLTSTKIMIVGLSALLTSCATDQQNAVWNQRPLLSMEFMTPEAACRQLERMHPGRKYVYSVIGYADGTEKKEYSYFTDPDCNGIKHTAMEMNNERPIAMNPETELYNGEDVASNVAKDSK